MTRLVLADAELARLRVLLTAAAALVAATSPRHRLPALALGLCLLAWSVAPFFGAFPVPFLGIGPSPIVGAWLGVVLSIIIVAAALVVGLVVIGSLLPDGSGKGDDANDANARETAGAADSASQDKEQKRTDPKPASYQGIDVTANYQIMLADNPPRPADGGDSGVSYNHGDLFSTTTPCSATRSSAPTTGSWSC